MKIFIKNKNPKDLKSNGIFSERQNLMSKDSSHEISRSVKFFAQHLGLDDDIEIKIVWIPLKEDVGLQTQIPEHDKKFIIKINSLVYPVLNSIELIHKKDYKQTNSLIVGLAHEVIHIKQFFKNELTFSDISFHPQGTIKWKNEYFTYIKTRSDFLTENAYLDYYKNLPWEKEAFDNMEKLSHRYLKYRSLILFKESITSKISKTKRDFRFFLFKKLNKSFI